MSKNKRAVFQGFVSSTTMAEDVLAFNTEGQLDFSANGQMYRDIGCSEDWLDDWPPQKVIITVEIRED